MKARTPVNLTAKDRKAINEEIRRQCIEQTAQYEAELDVVVLYALHNVFGFGKERLERFYREMFKLREEMKQRYGTSDDDTMGDFAMYVKLKEIGVDVQALYDEQNTQKFKVKVR